MAVGNLFGSGGESNSLYGTSLSNGGAIPDVSSFIYFEWFIFKVSASQPATPTGGTWDFLTNTGTPPTGWASTEAGIPLDNLWFSIAFVDSRNPTNVIWSEPGLISAATSVYATAYADTFTGTGSTTVWTLTADPVVVANLDVSINGVTQTPTVDYTISGTTFTTTTAAPLGSVLLVKYRQALPNSYFGTANNVGYTPYNWIAATNVQTALNEVADDISAVDGVSGSNLVGYLPAGTGAVATTVQAKLRQTVSVMDYVTSGTGTSGDPYLGWDTNTPWAANIEVQFPAGTFQYGTTLSLPYAGIYLHGVGLGTVLKFTGTGNCVSFDASINAPHIEGFLINGNANATNGIYTNNSVYGICKNITVKNVSVSGFRSIFGVYWHIEDFYMGNNFGAQTTFAAAGIYLGDSGSTQTVTAYTIVNANIADCVSSGIDINNGWTNTIIGGAVEANGNQGLYLGVNAHDNIINGLYIENNTISNAVINGTGNDFIGLWCVDSANKPIVFGSTSSNNSVYGGVYGAITINANAFRNQFTTTRLQGVWTDNGNGTVVNNVFSDNLAAYIHPTFVSSWTNNATYPYETFTSSGSNITLAINTTGLGIANSNSFYLVGGATYIFQWNVTLNSGALPGFLVSTNTAAAAISVSTSGNNVYMFKAGSSGLHYFTLRTESGIAANYSVSNVDVKQIN